MSLEDSSMPSLLHGDRFSGHGQSQDSDPRATLLVVDDTAEFVTVKDAVDYIVKHKACHTERKGLPRCGAWW